MRRRTPTSPCSRRRDERGRCSWRAPRGSRRRSHVERPARRRGRPEPPRRPLLVVAGSANPVTRGQLSRLGHRADLAVVAPPDDGRAQDPDRRRDTVARLAAAARDRVERERPGTILLTGGETAIAVLRALAAGGVAAGRAARARRCARDARGRALRRPRRADESRRLRGRGRARARVAGVRVTRPVLGITMGDPAGVGPEIAAKALAEPEVRDKARPLVIGDARVMAAAARLAGRGQAVRPLAARGEATFAPDRIEVLDLANADPAAFAMGRVSARLRARRLRVHRARRAALPGGRDRRHRHRAGEQGGARCRRRPSLGAHGDSGRAHGHQGLRHAPHGPGASRHPRHDPRGPPARPGAGHPRAGPPDDPPGRPGDAGPRMARPASRCAA